MGTIKKFLQAKEQKKIKMKTVLVVFEVLLMSFNMATATSNSNDTSPAFISNGLREFMWSTVCSEHEDYHIDYQAHFTPVQDWTQCDQFCADAMHEGTFAEFPDEDTWLCVKTYLQAQYEMVRAEYADKYAVHHWAAAERGADGKMRWRSGGELTFDDFVAEPGNNQYLHLQPENNYAWNTKNQEEDTNNGCLCSHIHYTHQ